MELSHFTWTDANSEGFGQIKIGKFKDNEIDLSDTQAEAMANNILRDLQDGKHVTFRID
ncbi:hypothetical protein [Leuconostoc falkenbergense]|uniref:hypothetical protein n=1 Tax=Leuconostoc falkenbergense TaxID=2766470 RepID=UPI00293C36A8|nr:hypothetical protein [Leuconostoc falkenbergense]MDV3544868.1 hypothetical protein [Leuconostoc falkenbergense]